MVILPDIAGLNSKDVSYRPRGEVDSLHRLNPLSRLTQKGSAYGEVAMITNRRL
jgi:hypothetical protein